MNDEKEQIKLKRLKEKKIMTVVGAALLIVGIILIIVFFVDFFDFMSGSKFGPPKLFWLPFIAFPMCFMGGALLFTARRVDAAALSMRDNSEIIDGYGKAVSFDTGFSERVTCGKCGAKSGKDAAFCSACGAELKIICDKCGGKNDAAARFCKYCGKSIDG
jgi:H+/Cl- antiporter ClcA